jgi:hypothetical protein
MIVFEDHAGVLPNDELVADAACGVSKADRLLMTRLSSQGPGEMNGGVEGSGRESVSTATRRSPNLSSNYRYASLMISGSSRVGGQ